MITLKNISKNFSEKAVLQNLHFTINKGDHIAIMAPSGAGKTTLANIIAGLLKPDSGEIIKDPNTTISYLFQEDRLLPWVSAFKNIDLVNRSKHKTDYFLKNLGLFDDREKYPSELSGGMNRRIALARCLAFKSDLYILDEPLKGLDERRKKTVISFLQEYLKDSTLLLITHDLSEAQALCDKFFNLTEN